MQNNQAFGMQGANPVYIVQQNQGVSKPEAQMPKVVSIVLASFLIFLAIVSFASQIVLIVYDNEYGIGNLGTGIWCGLCFGITGAVGIFASIKASSSSVTAYLVLSIISMCLCVPMFIIGIVGEIASQVNYYWSWDTDYNPYEDTQYAMNVLQVFIACITGTICLATTVIASRAVCCKGSNVQGSVMYNRPGMVYGVQQAVPGPYPPGQYPPGQYPQQQPLQYGVPYNGTPYQNAPPAMHFQHQQQQQQPHQPLQQPQPQPHQQPQPQQQQHQGPLRDEVGSE